MLPFLRFILQFILRIYFAIYFAIFLRDDFLRSFLKYFCELFAKNCKNNFCEISSYGYFFEILFCWIIFLRKYFRREGTVRRLS